ncbi:MAG: 50S ribosomal protein L29 [Parcubacteria group bacterium GW2011_GWA2_47_8b]|uniref:Large ribosomal subunit protein uL29 n=2 Tax=Candidatus Harrisoniibacteriota TaxID=1817905 RepID=A0A1G1ZWP2_9BACT|nr:MAG: 50S ribosomal protein L29 [Parcubacteria group bacterium GW2011_GWA2_47_8b]KKU93271.1 MAG: 50S ribosomal protein L29 [Parcubacteria group bacterium GW2011_GWA1_48_11b]OGY65050.1 MAG: 50S ribosomal protein L29 [Candidatus Harrisonbacteria bacterium RIFCSPHIGHO2_12_FULL_48_16]OGY68586.1 MAG: 50S ribosomal protein L29 [Candidatus Harrisonbacteria bacterium RIFOXYA1_FULL_48_8]
MKKNELEQLKNKPVGELKRNLMEHRDRLWNLKTDLAAGKVKNVKEIQKVKKTIARILTFIHGK